MLCLKWMWYKDKIEDMRSGLKMVPEKYFFPDGDPGQMPEVFYTFKECRFWNTLWWPGTLADQPHILMDEFNACQSAEYNFENNVLPPMLEQHLSLIRAEEQRQAQQRGY